MDLGNGWDFGCATLTIEHPTYPSRRNAARVFTRPCLGGCMKDAFIVTGLTILLLVASLPGSVTQPVSAQTPGEVVVKLVAEVSDADTWLAFRESLLAAPTDTSRIATITVQAQTGGTKSIVLNMVKFQSKAVVTDRSIKVLVTISGKMAGVPALRTLEVFEQAVFQMQAGLIANEVAMTYGMSGVSGRLTEIKVSAPASDD